MKVADEPMNRFRVISSVHDITIGLSDFVALPEQYLSMSVIMNPTVLINKTGCNLENGINSD